MVYYLLSAFSLLDASFERNPCSGSFAMLASGRCLLVGVLAIPILLALGVPADARILIDDAPVTPDETMVTVPLVGYRAFPKAALVAVDPQRQNWVLDTSLLYDAAANDSDFLARAGSNAPGVRTFPVGKVIAIYQQAPLKIPAECDLGLIWTDKKAGLGQTSDLSPCPSSSYQPVTLATAPRLQGTYFDKNVVQLALAKGAIERTDATNPYSVRVVKIPGSNSYGVAVKPWFAKDVTELYSALDKVSQTNVSASEAFYFGNASQAAWREGIIPLTHV